VANDKVSTKFDKDTVTSLSKSGHLSSAWFMCIIILRFLGCRINVSGTSPVIGYCRFQLQTCNCMKS